MINLLLTLKSFIGFLLKGNPRVKDFHKEAEVKLKGRPQDLTLLLRLWGLHKKGPTALQKTQLAAKSQVLICALNQRTEAADSFG